MRRRRSLLRRRSTTTATTRTTTTYSWMQSVTGQVLLLRSVPMMMIIILLHIILVVFVEAGRIPYDIQLVPNSTLVQYNDGYFRAPGYIDLGGLRFTPSSSSSSGAVATAATQEQPTEKSQSTTIDIAVFSLPSGCSKGTTTATTKTKTKKSRAGSSKNKCDWSDLGIGQRRTDTGTMMWCCSDEAVALGMCSKDGSNYQRLLINNNMYRGEHRFIDIPMPSSSTETQKQQSAMIYSLPPEQGRINENVSGTYIVLYANCDNEYNTETSVYISGTSIWKSKHGYLPGELYGFMTFYYTVTILYMILLASYRYMMNINTASHIHIEKWIMISIAMGLLELIVRSLDYYTWNADGTRSTVLFWFGILMGVLKQGISRCLLVMVSMGWGVTRDTLGTSMKWIILFGSAYICIATLNNSIVAIAYAYYDDWLSGIFADGVIGAIHMLTAIKILIDTIFIVWVLDSLKRTIQVLAKLDQSQKLARICHVRNIFFCSVCLTILYGIFAWAHSRTAGGMLEKQYAWASDAATEANYLFVLIGIAILWRPNKDAKQYVYTMELPTIENGSNNSNSSNKDRASFVPLLKDNSKSAD